jgi:hypothetical protein
LIPTVVNTFLLGTALFKGLFGIENLGWLYLKLSKALKLIEQGNLLRGKENYWDLNKKCVLTTLREKFLLQTSDFLVSSASF